METRKKTRKGRFQVVKLEERIAPTCCLVPSVSATINTSVGTCPPHLAVSGSVSVGGVGGACFHVDP